MKSKLKVIGLGRCIIGYMLKDIKSDDSLNVELDHHYLLNYQSIIKSSIKADSINEYNDLKIVPSLNDQWLCLENITSYDVCLIEVFPSPPIYKHNKKELYATFESYTTQIKEKGFEQFNDSTDYPKILDNLIKKIRKLNKTIQIVLINGEITRQGKETYIGSNYLQSLLLEIKETVLSTNKNVHLVDMNEIIETLEAKDEMAYEVAFPYLYLRRLRGTTTFIPSRDCKHATPEIRRMLCYSMLDLVLPNFDKKIVFEKIYKSEHYEVRGIEYINKVAQNPLSIQKIESPRELSLLISYALDLDANISIIDQLDKYLFDFCKKYPLETIHLKEKVNHFRTLQVYIHEKDIDCIKELTQVGLRVLNLDKDELDKYLNFATQWTTWILRTLYNSKYKSTNKEYIDSYLTNVTNNAKFISCDEINYFVKEINLIDKKSI